MWYDDSLGFEDQMSFWDTEWASWGYNDRDLPGGSNDTVTPGPDHDGDGDRDVFDMYYERPRVPGEEFPGSDAFDIRGANAVHEFLEDLAELMDNNPNNDSFFDGGNGSGNETPTPNP